MKENKQYKLQAISKIKSGNIKFPYFIASTVRKIEVGPSPPIIATEPTSFPKKYEGTNNAGAKMMMAIAIKSKANIDFLNIRIFMLTPRLCGKGTASATAA